MSRGYPSLFKRTEDSQWAIGLATTRAGIRSNAPREQCARDRIVYRSLVILGSEYWIFRRLTASSGLGYSRRCYRRILTTISGWSTT